VFRTKSYQIAGMDFYLVIAGIVTLTLIVLTCASWTAPYRGIRDESAIGYTVVPPTELQQRDGPVATSTNISTSSGKNLTAGSQFPSESPGLGVYDVINCECPADGRSLGHHITSRPLDIDEAIERATTAQHTWATSSFPQRRRLLKSLLRHILDRQESITAACCLDSGKTKIDGCFGEILVTVEKLQWTIKHGERALAASRRPTNLLMSYKKNTVRYEPLGVVAACVSWNYPFHNFISPVISALFAGNAIMVKPSEQTCWSSAYFTDIIRGALKACGHSPELVQNVVCLPDVADHLTSHPGISHITFIGSREVAHKVCASAAKALTPVTVELGGKDPAVVLEDASLDEAAAIIMRGVFQSAGQNCIGIERVIALPRVHDRLLEIVLPKIKQMRLGSVLLDELSSESASGGTQGGQTSTPESSHTGVPQVAPRPPSAPFTPDMGSMISSRSFIRLESLISSAVTAGATLHHGGRPYNHPLYPNGHYFLPTLLSGVTPGMAIAQTELFAPIFLLMKTTDIEDAVRIANSTPYALGASVFGQDQNEVQRCVKGMKAGMVSVNDFGSYYACSMPFGGVTGSGYGRFGGEEGLRALCNVKAVCEDAGWARLLGIRTKIPAQLQYPIQNGQKGWEMCLGIVGLGYGINLTEKANGLWRLVQAAMSKNIAK
jgi:acyl-CoA reductase-like NAD-dependent aldehyde dehydrogenase